MIGNRTRMVAALVALCRALATAALLLCGAGVGGTAAAECIRPEGAGGFAPASLHFPADATRHAPIPLLVLLHGSTSTGRDMLRESGLAATADRHGFIVAAPDGGIRSGNGFVWNIPGVPSVSGAMPGPGDRDDVAFILAGIDQLIRAGCVDGTRVYVTGLSGGGRMTSWLGCVAADRFAAIAPVVGLRAGRPSKEDAATPDPATCRPVRSMPVIAFAGDADTTNPIAGGGAPYWQYSMQAAEQRWAALNGCTMPRPTRWLDQRVYEEGYAGCRDGAEVVGRVTRGGPHSWSTVDNEAMWAFLSSHHR
ncbi:polyhydroxybutyrate depolymerase [Sphingomonas gellani]|uniref:Polyhydroxybutyrate depolymerase n=1 Tax=Sphingomonas gellani TaxID=1166340 RepID=A0A1H8IVX0_9SPHN|nr:PHB depolymerase family esterase [Sphingomonas gellani]SEN72724.1 polyhydroxybutyrate depolymerase [Sphingomonas gellani]